MYNTLRNIVKEYLVAIYIRLSKEDETSGESESIGNQKILLTKYVKEHTQSEVTDKEINKYYDEDEIKLKEIVIDKNHKWCNKCISNLSLSDDILIAMIKRGDENIIPRGRSKIKENDIVVIYNSNKKV